MNISKEDFLEWKNQKVTKAIVLAFKAKYDSGVNELVQSAGVDSTHDCLVRGKLKGLEEFLDITYYDLEEVNND